MISLVFNRCVIQQLQVTGLWQKVVIISLVGILFLCALHTKNDALKGIYFPQSFLLLGVFFFFSINSQGDEQVNKTRCRLLQWLIRNPCYISNYSTQNLMHQSMRDIISDHSFIPQNLYKEFFNCDVTGFSITCQRHS